MLLEILVTLLKAVGVALGLLTTFAYMTLIERRLLGRFQTRPGPNRVGPLGLLQPVADAIKSIFKEDLKVTMGDKVIFGIAPLISITMALTAFGALPAGPEKSLFGTNPQIFNLDIGLLFILATTSMGVYGIFLAGWASGSKYPLLGGLRSSAQIISYELGQGLSVLGLLMIVGSMNLYQIVHWQAQNGWMVLFQVVAFMTFLVSAFAETNRTPFDLPEAEQELVAGYLTEYSSIKWALFQMAEYVNMITASALIATLFFGGYQGPQFLGWIGNIPFLWFYAKIGLFLFIFIWVRATLPRMRYDKLMQFGWKFLFPVALVNTLATAAYRGFIPGPTDALAQDRPWVLGIAGLVAVLLIFAYSTAITARPVRTSTRAVGGGD
jgi:NADH-quinone oxidoreductase subunit H